MEKDYFENSELNTLLTYWLGNSPQSFHTFDVERFIQFSIRALELGKYDFSIIAKSLRENNAHAQKDERIIEVYERYFYAIDILYQELKKQGKVL